MSHTYGMLLFVAYGIQASSHFAVPTAQLYGLTDDDEHRYEAFIGPVTRY